jgi:hypothetical protein
MTQKISIQYQLANSTKKCVALIMYTMEREEDLLKTSCYIEASLPHILPWLPARNFIVRSIHENGHYRPLLNESDYGNTVDAILFMEKAYNAIMVKEKLPVLEDEHELLSV